jgi:hypothetical protein
MFPKVSKPYNYIYAGVALDALVSEVQPLSRAAARSSLHPSPKFCICSLRSGELSTKVRRAFPATLDISGEFRFHSEVCLVVLFTGTSFFSRIHQYSTVFSLIISFRWSFPASISIGVLRVSLFQGHLRSWLRTSRPGTPAQRHHHLGPLAPHQCARPQPLRTVGVAAATVLCGQELPRAALSQPTPSRAPQAWRRAPQVWPSGLPSFHS